LVQAIDACEAGLRPTVSSLRLPGPDRALQHVIPMIPPATPPSARIAGVRVPPADPPQQSGTS
jgi:hypothetical protein